MTSNTQHPVIHKSEQWIQLSINSPKREGKSKTQSSLPRTKVTETCNYPCTKYNESNLVSEKIIKNKSRMRTTIRMTKKHQLFETDTITHKLKLLRRKSRNTG